jgi:endonuclease/exonuclease/phosphatase family metal-dependent hydrolase
MAFGLKVLTYNIHKGYCTGNRRFVLENIRELLEQTNADIVFLQEIHGETHKRKRKRFSYPTTPHFEYLADQLWPHFAYGKNAIYKKGHHGNAILSKYPFHLWENINVALFRRASRSILHGVIELPGQHFKLHTLCVHLGLFEAERRQQLKTLTERIESHIPHNEPLIIAGDFNDWRGKAENHLKKSLDVKELFLELQGKHAKTFPIWYPIFPIDRIYYRGCKPHSSFCFSKGPWRKLSDHAALCGAFSFEAPAGG